MADLSNLQRELESLKIQKKQAEDEMSKQKGRSYELGFWWGTYCMIDHQIDKVQFQISETKKSAVAGRSRVISQGNMSSLLF